jgi:hypothetical protein
MGYFNGILFHKSKDQLTSSILIYQTINQANLIGKELLEWPKRRWEDDISTDPSETVSIRAIGLIGS